jgi:hypothetical protein
MIKTIIKKFYFTIFLYVSFGFLIYFLATQDILFIPEIHSSIIFYSSVLFLISGFIFESFSWYYILKTYGVNLTFKTTIISSGSAILGKYIPGKIWTVVGRAKIVADQTDKSLSDISFISFESQIIFLWTGLVLSLIGSIFVNIGISYLIVVALVLVLFSTIIFSNKYKSITEKLLKSIFKKEYEIPRISLNKSSVIFLNFIPWIIWAVGFFLIASSITAVSLPYSVSYSFIIASTFGIIAIFSPGGLGVREGIMAGYLTLCGLDLSSATTISVFSRLWFIAGEIFIFLLGMCMHYITKKK